MANMSHCPICGTEYHVCPTCERVRRYTPFRIVCDTIEHYQVLLLIQQYDANLVDKRMAKEMLDNIGLAPGEVETFLPDVQDKLREILTEGSSKTRKAKADAE